MNTNDNIFMNHIRNHLTEGQEPQCKICRKFYKDIVEEERKMGLLKIINDDNFHKIHKISWILNGYMFILAIILTFIIKILGTIIFILFLLGIGISGLLVLYGIWEDYDFIKW